MKRNVLAFVLCPYKNELLPRARLKEAIDFFAENVIELSTSHPHLRFNLALPGYILESTDPLLLSQLREVSRHGTLEWVITGYTEPFMSFSPMWLTGENIRYGHQTFTELTGASPAGFRPPFSNWEPSYTETLRAAGISHTVLSSELLPMSVRHLCGYWMTEHAGSSMALFPSYILHHHTVPADLISWLENLYARDTSESSSEKIVTIQYMIPLQEGREQHSYKWLEHAAVEIDKRILSYQPALFRELLGAVPPLGLQYIPPSLPCINARAEWDRYFLNYLHSFDQIGILQRKLMDICDLAMAQKDSRHVAQMKQQLFHAQDINRFLPMRSSGFTIPRDRAWSYGRLIDIEKEFHAKTDIRGGQIRIADFLRNGNKCIIMANHSLKAYVDHRNGGHIFELDFRDRSLNVCAAYNPQPHALPNVISTGKSKTSFIDRILPTESRSSDFIANTYRDLGNFSTGRFEYKVKKTPSGVKTILNRQGSILRGDRNCPLSMEKVFGLEKDGAELSFVYQLANHSLMTYDFRFAVELSFCFPGAYSDSVRIVTNRDTFGNVGREYVALEGVTKWHIDDAEAGMRVQFITQKPLDIWCLPSIAPGGECDPTQWVSVVLTSPVSLEESSVWSMMGKIGFKKIKKTGQEQDAI